MTSASATTTPSTLATLALRCRIFISMRRVSPGTTGRRKRAFSMATRSTSLLARSGISWSTRMPGFGDDDAIDGGHAGHLGHAGFALEDLHLHAQGVAGHHGAE